MATATENTEPEKTTTGGTIIARRYSKKIRIQHWGNSLAMLLFMLTGTEIYLQQYPFGGYDFTQTLHIYLGVFIVFWSVILYPIFVTMDKKWHTIIPTPKDIVDLVLILGVAFKILNESKYPKYDFYDPNTKKYVAKYHPTQKLLATGNFVFLIFIAITGFALLEAILPGMFFGVGEISMNMIQPILDLGIDLRFLHFVIFLYFAFGTAVHFYFTQLPQNRGRLSGMITGREPIQNRKD